MKTTTSADTHFLLGDLLRDVSRSFYLTLRLLPSAIRDQIGLAYLLARATDTIADSGSISVENRLSTLKELRSWILGQSTTPFSLPDLRGTQNSEGERVLLERIPDALNLLAQTPPGDRQLIQRVLDTITSGQELDLARFGHASAQQIAALESAQDLNDYTYRVAGCVGEFWTEMCLSHLTPAPRVPTEKLRANGVRFGKGLQLVNILRDLPADLRLGRCYLPEQSLTALGLRPLDLLDPTNAQRLKPLYDTLLTEADQYLNSAWSYVLDLPRSWIRVRLASALPVLIGVKTLNKLRSANVLNPDTRIKVSRADIKRIMRASIFLYPLNSVWKNLPARVARP